MKTEKIKTFFEKHPNIAWGATFLILPPVATYGMWKHTQWSKWLKIGLSAYAAIWTLTVIVPKPTETNSLVKEEAASTSPIATPAPHEDEQPIKECYSKLTDSFGYEVPDVGCVPQDDRIYDYAEEFSTFGLYMKNGVEAVDSGDWHRATVLFGKAVMEVEDDPSKTNETQVAQRAFGAALNARAYANGPTLGKDPRKGWVLYAGYPPDRD